VTGSVAEQVLALTHARPALLGGGRLVSVDGPAGAGKSTLARALADTATRSGTSVTLVHLDDLLAGWAGGVDRMVRALVADVLEPLATARPAAYHRYDWHADAFTETVPVEPVDLLVVEGVGAGARAVAPYCSTLVWVEAPVSVRRERGIARDGDAFAPHWDAWARMEEAHFVREGTRDRADLVHVTA